MKKLLVLSLVLVIASLANAGLSISAPAGGINPGDSFTISFTYDQGEIGAVSIREVTDSASAAVALGGLVTGETLHANLTLGRKINVAGTVDADRNTARIIYSASGDALGGAFGIGGPKVPVGEEVFSITVQTSESVAAGEYTINFVYGKYKVGSSSTQYDLGSIGYTIVPEPATMLLLGLGALVLRRK